MDSLVKDDSKSAHRDELKNTIKIGGATFLVSILYFIQHLISYFGHILGNLAIAINELNVSTVYLIEARSYSMRCL